MNSPKAFWIGIICALGGCTQLLELDQDYRPSPIGNAGAGGSSGMGGMAGSGGGQACNQPSDCTMFPAEDECKTRTCNNHTCGQTFAAMGTLLVTQVMGDCLEAFCDGAGKTMTQPANMDVPEDNNPCTKNICNAGVPSFPFEPINTSCGVNQKCNDVGQCIGCMVANDCAGTDDFCKVRICTNGLCGFDFTATGTDLPDGQTAKDCKVVECDGQGNIIISADNADIPVDGNECTKDVCTAGVPSNPAEPANTACGTGGVCGAGVCKTPNGTMCMTGATCVSGICTEGYCCDSGCTGKCKACNLPGLEGTCSTVPAGYADDSCLSPKSCDGTTGGNSCTNKYPVGYPCTLASQCGSSACVDEVCCNSLCAGSCKACNVAGKLGICSNVPAGSDDSPTCVGTNTCDGNGNCKKESGQSCSNAGDCLNAFCIDGVCCNSACLATCQACDVTGLIGTCVNVLSGQEDPIATTACTGVNSCNGAGACLLDNGQPCMNNTQCVSNNCTGMPLTCQ